MKITALTLISFVLLYYGKPFLVPLLVASLLAMLLLPLCIKRERRLNKAVAAVLSVLLLLIVTGGVI